MLLVLSFFETPQWSRSTPWKAEYFRLRKVIFRISRSFPQNSDIPPPPFFFPPRSFRSNKQVDSLPRYLFQGLLKRQRNLILLSWNSVSISFPCGSRPFFQFSYSFLFPRERRVPSFLRRDHDRDFFPSLSTTFSTDAGLEPTF